MGTGQAEAALTASDIAAEQWGIVTTPQLAAEGVSAVQLRRLAEKGIVEQLHQGVYRLVRFPTGPLDDLRAAWIGTDRRRLAAERLDGSAPLIVVSHRSAAAVYGAGDLPADTHELTATRRMRLSIPDLRIHVDAGLDRAAWDVVDGMPVTTPARTVADLAAGGVDGEHLGAIIRDLLQSDRASVDELADALAPYAAEFGHAAGDGRGVLDDLVERVGISRNTQALADVIARREGPLDPGTMDLLAARIFESAGGQRMMAELSEKIQQTFAESYRLSSPLAGLDMTAISAALAPAWEAQAAPFREMSASLARSLGPVISDQVRADLLRSVGRVSLPPLQQLPTGTVPEDDPAN